jgi:predicted enzyme related to lactoylglutathione lyase
MTLTLVADATNRGSFVSDGDAYWLAWHKREEEGIRPYPQRCENLATTYGVIRKRIAIGGDGTWTKAQLARDLYPEVGDDPEQAKKKQSSIKRWLKALQQLGLIRYEELCSPAGKSLGLRIELVPMEDVAQLARASACHAEGRGFESLQPLSQTCRQQQLVDHGNTVTDLGATPMSPSPTTANGQIVTGVDFVALSTKDLDAAVKFYRDTLGLPMSVHLEERSYAEFETGNLTLSVIDAEKMGMEHQVRGHEIALQVDDLEAARKTLEERGVSFRGDTIDTGVCHMGLFNDPDGNPLMLHHRYAPRSPAA